MTRYYSRRELVRSALDRLSLIHSSDYMIVSGKNRLRFELDGEYFWISKTEDKTMNKSKTIIEGQSNNMIPIILYQSEDDMYTDRDVEETVCGLDRYFICERARKSPSLAICNKFYYLSDLLKTYGYDLEAFVGEAEISDPRTPEDSYVILIFRTEDASSGEPLLVFFIIEDYSMKIAKFRYDEEKASLDTGDENLVDELVIEYEGMEKEEITAAALDFLKDEKELVPYMGRFTYMTEVHCDA